MPHVYVDLLFRPWSCKDVSDLKACLDPPRSCEKLNIGFPAKTEQNFVRQMGGKVQMFTTSCHITIIHPHFLNHYGFDLIDLIINFLKLNSK